MNLTEEDIINAVDSYRSKGGLTNDDMAPLCGMANGSVYFKWVNKKTKGGKLNYLLDFLKNTNQSITDLFETKKKAIYLPGADLQEMNENIIEVYSCPDCRPRVKLIKEQEEEIKNLKEELLQVYRVHAKKEPCHEDNTSSGEDTKRSKAS